MPSGSAQCVHAGCSFSRTQEAHIKANDVQCQQTISLLRTSCIGLSSLGPVILILFGAAVDSLNGYFIPFWMAPEHPWCSNLMFPGYPMGMCCFHC